jgi:hypothetical protein
MSIRRISARAGTGKAYFRVPSTLPVDCHGDFIRGFIQIYNNLLYQNPCQPLLCSHGSPGRIPDGCQIVCECQQAFLVDSRARSCLFVHAGKPLLQFSDTLKCDVPS